MCVCVSVCKKIVLKSKINFYWSIFFKSQKRQSLSPVSLESKKSLVQCSQDFRWRKSENWKDKHEFIQEKRRIRDLEISLFLHWPCDIRAPFVFCYCCLFSLEIKHTNCPGYRNRAVANVPSDLTLFYWFPPNTCFRGWQSKCVFKKQTITGSCFWLLQLSWWFQILCSLHHPGYS